jgi:hypothetical protein
MNTQIFSAFGRSVAPVMLAASTLLGTLGFSSVASAQERVVVAAPAPVVVAAPQPVVEEVVVGGPRFHVGPYVTPYYYGPGYARGYYGPGFRGYAGYRGWGGFHGGGFHGGWRR